MLYTLVHVEAAWWRIGRLTAHSLTTGSHHAGRSWLFDNSTYIIDHATSLANAFIRAFTAKRAGFVSDVPMRRPISRMRQRQCSPGVPSMTGRNHQPTRGEQAQNSRSLSAWRARRKHEQTRILGRCPPVFEGPGHP